MQLPAMTCTGAEDSDASLVTQNILPHNSVVLVLCWGVDGTPDFVGLQWAGKGAGANSALDEHAVDALVVPAWCCMELAGVRRRMGQLVSTHPIQ